MTSQGSGVKPGISDVMARIKQSPRKKVRKQILSTPPPSPDSKKRMKKAGTTEKSANLASNNVHHGIGAEVAGSRGTKRRAAEMEEAGSPVEDKGCQNRQAGGPINSFFLPKSSSRSGVIANPTAAQKVRFPLQSLYRPVQKFSVQVKFQSKFPLAPPLNKCKVLILLAADELAAAVAAVAAQSSNPLFQCIQHTVIYRSLLDKIQCSTNLHSFERMHAACMQHRVQHEFCTHAALIKHTVASMQNECNISVASVSNFHQFISSRFLGARPLEPSSSAWYICLPTVTRPSSTPTCMSSGRPSRIIRPTLRPDLLLVPLTSRRNHPDFPQPTPDFPQPTPESPPTPEPLLDMASADGPEQLPAGHRRPVDSLFQIADAALFHTTLNRLVELTGHDFLPSSHGDIVKRDEKAHLEVKIMQSPILTDKLGSPISQESSLILIGLQMGNDHQESFIVVHHIPFAAFASDLLKAASESKPRVRGTVKKWGPENIFVAFSRQPLSIDDPSHNSIKMGFLDIGYYSDIIDNKLVHGRRSDILVPTVVHNSEAALALRDVYEVSPAAKVYALYLYYHDAVTRAAGLAAGDFSPVRVSTKTIKKEPIPQSLPANPTSTGQDASGSSPIAQAYLQQHASALMEQYRLINSATTIESGYKAMAGVRLVRAIYDKLQSPWPTRGLPAPQEVEFKDTFFSFSISDILEGVSGPMASTFRNHNNTFVRARKAFAYLQEENNQRRGTAEDRTKGNLLHVLVNYPVVDLRQGAMADGYKNAAGQGFESLKAYVKGVMKRGGLEQRGGPEHS
ncbi:hypothetical protein DFH06DRAFT_1296597 [Mycena polygramma]|nr:hypothetical protein DFH06DRAFT_1296597 [Mycena polygramma]